MFVIVDKLYMGSVGIADFKQLHTDVKNFNKKIVKEQLNKQEDLECVNKLLVDIELLEDIFSDLKLEFNKLKNTTADADLALRYGKEIENSLSISKRILLDKLEFIEQINKTTLNMTEKFDIRTAASLLPCMDGSEDTTKQLIDSIELYSGLLNEEGKKCLINYVLKTRLSQGAKLRLANTYPNVENLISDIRKHLLTKKSAAALANDLHNARQEHKSIDQFSKTIEDLFINLTLSQADGNDNRIPILREVNEKIAINAFSNGLKNSELRTIVKARDYSTLKDAIVGAKDEERLSVSSSSHSVFHARQNNFGNAYRSFNNRGNRGQFASNRKNFNFNKNNNFNRPHTAYNNNMHFNNNHNNFRGQGRGVNRGRVNYRGNQNRNRNHRNYFTDTVGNETPSFSGNSNTGFVMNKNEPNQRFFRD